MRVLIMFIAAVIVFAGNAHGFGKGEKNCAGECNSCHKANRDEIAGLLKSIDPNATVKGVSPSKVKGWFEVLIENKGNKGSIYVDYTKQYLFLGNIIEIASKKNISSQKQAEEKKVVKVSQITLDNALVMGNRNGSKRLIVFSDPECPYCAKLHAELDKLVKADLDVAVFIILYPLEIHPDAKWKTEAIICKSKENMEEAMKMLENSYAKKEVRKADCGKKYADANFKLSKKIGITATPTSVLPNGRIMVGSVPDTELLKALNDNRKK